MARRRVAIALLLLGFVGTVGCSKKVGDSCSSGVKVCADKDKALFCVDGKLLEMACRGPAGCADAKDEVFCDNKVAGEKDGCDQGLSTLACTMDKKSELRCKANKFVLTSTCRGPGGCTFEGTTLKCDTDVADPKDPCEDEGDLSCALDGKSLLRCKKEKYVVEGTCKGPDGCKSSGGNFRCDDSKADVGDACHVENNFACTFDGKALLACHDHTFKLDRPCKKSCTAADAPDKRTFDCH